MGVVRATPSDLPHALERLPHLLELFFLPQLHVYVAPLSGEDGSQRSCLLQGAGKRLVAILALVNERVRGFHLLCDLGFHLLQGGLVLPQQVVNHLAAPKIPLISREPIFSVYNSKPLSANLVLRRRRGNLGRHRTVQTPQALHIFTT